MIMRTHLALGVALLLIFLPHVGGYFIFIPVLLIATLLPDVDSGFSYMGRKPLFRPLQFFVRHRGILHSLTICVVFSLLLSFYFPSASLAFFLGYSFHLLADSFTIEGIEPFWPFKTRISGTVRTGGRIEDGFFVLLVAFDLFLVVLFFI